MILFQTNQKRGVFVKKNIIEKYNELKKEIEEANYNYYVLDKPIITDEVYDRMFNEVKEIESNYPELISNEEVKLSENVGGEILKGFERKEHSVPMLSLDKAQDKARVEKFIKDTSANEYVLEWKYDGLAFVARFENGKFIEARTRGNGFEGEVITEQLKMVDNFPQNIPFLGVLEVSGEIYMPYDSYERYNERQMELIENESVEIGLESATKKYPLLQNPRNGAAGAIRQLDLSVTKRRKLETTLFNILVFEGESDEPKTQTETKKFLEKQGYNTTLMLESYYSEDMEDLMNILDECEVERKNLPFEVDGLVLKVNDKKTQEEIGYTSNFPKWAIAYKFEAIEKQTKLKEIIWEVGRTGRVTPVALFEPIDFDGVIVTRATLNNPDYIKILGMKEDSELVVRRSNDVIPQVTSVIGESTGKKVKIPTECPNCEGILRFDNPLLFCDNKTTCSSQIEAKIKHFASRDAMDISGLSDKTIEQLLRSELIQDVPDLYDLNMEDLLRLERFGDKKAANLLEAISKSKNIEWHRFIYSLGIKTIGRRASKTLTEEYKTLDSIYQAKPEDFMTLKDFGEKTAQIVCEYFSEEKNKEMIKELLKKGVSPYVKSIVNAEKTEFSEKSFVITGKLTNPRKHYKEKIESLGGVVRGSVSKNTDYLLAGESAGSKYRQAQDLEVKILTESDFNDLIS